MGALRLAPNAGLKREIENKTIHDFYA